MNSFFLSNLLPQLLHVIRGGLVRRRASYFNSPDKEVLVRIMHKILSDSEVCCLLFVRTFVCSY